MKSIILKVFLKKTNNKSLAINVAFIHDGGEGACTEGSTSLFYPTP